MFDELKNATPQEKKNFVAAVMKSAEAREALTAGDAKQGIALYREAIEICPPCEMRGNYQVLLGEHLFDFGDAAAAEAALRAALEGSLSYPYEAFRRLAFALAVQGKFDEAILALASAIELGEDLCFGTQAAAAYMIAGGHMAHAIDAVAHRPELADCDPDYHRRLVMVRAELARLADDDAGLRSALDEASGLRAHDGSEMDPDVALWLAVLDRASGRDALRPEIMAAFGGTPPTWPELTWQVLNGTGSPADLVSALEKESWTRRAEILSQYQRFAGLLAEQSGDLAGARRHYEAARAEPFTQWCLDYHLAGIGLERLKPA